MPAFLIDITRLLGRLLKGRLATGVDRVDLAYVEHYGHRARAVVRMHGRSIGLSMGASQAVFEQLVTRREALPWSIGARVLRGILMASREAPIAGSLVLNTGHSGLHQLAYARHLRAQGLRPVFMVHDLIPITHHEYCRAGERERHMQRMDTVLDTAAGVVTNSQVTLDELALYAKQRGKPMPPAQCARLAPGLPRLAAGPRPIPEPYFVMLGTIEPRKNHWMLLQVWRRLVERLGLQAPRLVVVGQRGWECENVMDLLERCEPLRGVVIEQASCTDAELTTWLHHAQALLFPSFVEGYGLPLVEALMLETPVIASDLRVFREIAGDIPDYLDPLDGLGWMDRIEHYALSDSPGRAAQKARMAGFTAPTWAEHFRAVDALLERLQGDRHPS